MDSSHGVHSANGQATWILRAATLPYMTMNRHTTSWHHTSAVTQHLAQWNEKQANRRRQVFFVLISRSDFQKWVFLQNNWHFIIKKEKKQNVENTNRNYKVKREDEGKEKTLILN